jgi:hypothetical protein
MGVGVPERTRRLIAHLFWSDDGVNGTNDPVCNIDKGSCASGQRFRLLYASPPPEIDIGTFRNGALILVSDYLAGFHFDINGIVSEQTKGTIRRRQFAQTLSISHPVGWLTVAGELWHFTHPLTSRNVVGNLWAVSYPVRKNLVLDAGFNHAPTYSSTQWEGFAGFTYLLFSSTWEFHDSK